MKELEKYECNIFFDISSLDYPFFMKYEMKPKGLIKFTGFIKNYTYSILTCYAMLRT